MPCPHLEIHDPTFLLDYLTKLTKVRLFNHLVDLPLELLTQACFLLNIQKFEFKCEACNRKGKDIIGNFYACLSCLRIGCWCLGTDLHLKDHFKSTKDHVAAIEVNSGTLYCSVCDKFIWCSELEAAKQKHLPLSIEEPEVKKKLPVKKKLVSNPDKTQAVFDPIIDQSELQKGVDGIILRHCKSFRGLINMGNTCFMNSVLQVLLHISSLMTFFLSSIHNSQSCSRKSSKAPCIACELDSLFMEMYNGSTKPFAPNTFLLSVWQSAKHLAGYEQQDAHEFLMSLLNQLHSDLGGGNFACKCLVHSIFTGVLQSDVTCLSCGTVNPSFDPFMDISLDIATTQDLSFIYDQSINKPSLSLHDCFRHFTESEKLSSETYMCANCNHTYQEATKQLSIRKAPPILVIHLKRFEHTSSIIKVDDFVQFPLRMSIFDYTTEGLAQVPNESFKKYDKSLIYRLIATVNHTGAADSGHYVSYISSLDGHYWFKADDAGITMVPASTVLSTNPYMLFYTCVIDEEK